MVRRRPSHCLPNKEVNSNSSKNASRIFFLGLILDYRHENSEPSPSYHKVFLDPLQWISKYARKPFLQQDMLNLSNFLLNFSTPRQTICRWDPRTRIHWMPYVSWQPSPVWAMKVLAFCNDAVYAVIAVHGT